MRNSLLVILICPVVFILSATGQNFNPDFFIKSNQFIYQQLKLPILNSFSSEKPLLIAVVDDGFRLTHKTIKPFVFTNKNEIPGNQIDDDQNGFVDDVNGWDISDNDNNVSIPTGRELEFYHGTAISSIIADVLLYSFGSRISEKVKILPVKVLADNSEKSYLKDGYRGIKYALQQHPDIICCAWSGGNPTDDEKKMLENAAKTGTMVICSAGNFFAEKDQFPACINGVWSISAIDSLQKKIPEANYGMRVDFSTYGKNVKAAHPLADNSFNLIDGTSPATALMAGCAAILKFKFPDVSYNLILEALKNTASPLDSFNVRYCGKLGAGIPNISKACDYITNSKIRNSFFNSKLPEGTIVFDTEKRMQIVEIQPYGNYSGFFFVPKENEKAKGEIKFYVADSLYFSSSIKNLKETFIPSKSVKVEVVSTKNTLKKFQLEYNAKTIDSTKLFCSDIVRYSLPEAEITDGSGEFDYANWCDCKWLITAPTDKKIMLDFTELDTQAKIDFVWIFDGQSTIMDAILAKFSGQEKPPVIVSTTNQVLVWFTTNGTKTGKGWKLKYKFVD